MSTSNVTSSAPSEEEWTYRSRFILVVCVHMVNYTFGLFLQSNIMALLLSRRRRLDPCDVFTLNQAAAEIFFMLFPPFHILLSFTPGMWFHKPLGLFLGTGMSVRALFQCCVCLERYVAVVHPIAFLKFRPLRYRVGICGMVWVGGLPSGITCMFTFPSIPYKNFGMIFFLIMSVNVFCCVSILTKLRHPGPGERTAERWAEDRAKKRAFHVVLLNLLTFVVQNTPIAVLFASLNTLPTAVFRLSADVCLGVNLAVGWMQPLFVLHKAGRFSWWI